MWISQEAFFQADLWSMDSFIEFFEMPLEENTVCIPILQINKLKHRVNDDFPEQSNV